MYRGKCELTVAICEHASWSLLALLCLNLLILFVCSQIQVLESTYYSLAEALAMHCRIADTILFPELAKRKPGVAEAYSVDHYKQGQRLTQLHDLISTLNEAKTTELFLQVYRFTALDTEHVEKEEEHLLPHFLVNFADHELVNLMKKVETAQANAKLIQG
mmetsp:Transcript_20039/g.80306  ORF Transcript_20039/g.80306 Transcript_20039/m.80306 type:complete len:161 (+) Transcript_20039:1969-2451(+)